MAIQGKQTDTVSYSLEGSVAHISLNRPDKSNAYNSEMLDGLATIIQSIKDNTKISMVVIKSSSSVFCAGADLNEMQKRTFREVLNLKSRQIFETIHQSPFITVAVVDGSAVAGGFELALSCDFILATERAYFWLPEVGLGLLPAAGGISRLVELVGPSQTRKIIILGYKLDAYEAYRLGIVTRLVSNNELNKELGAMIKGISDKPDVAVQIAKKAIVDATLTQNSSSEIIAQALLNELRAKVHHSIND